MKSADVEQILDRLAGEIGDVLAVAGVERPLVIGIHTGGLWVAQRLHERLGIEEPVGALDISFYRDDFTRIGMHPQVRPSNLPFAVDERHIVLVDDVLHTGRTIRAALNEIFDYGRPASVFLATLVERDGRELPIQANAVGLHLKLDANQHAKLTGPDSLELTITEIRPDSAPIHQ
jgi:pyrimidine operon attenuation protein/uracil phosphoribosyltransferase